MNQSSTPEHNTESSRNQAERELVDARAHFNDTLVGVSNASERVVERVREGVREFRKPLLFGTALLAAGVAVLLIARNSGGRRPILQIRMVAPRPGPQKAWVGLAAQLAIGLLTRQLQDKPSQLGETPHHLET